ncbi:uncharacterized protein F4807DRAFT_462242 [Annulohypoxylon truncatum]|uniref:uncharacterized protein n=1 Tax=Annulohypoxylon truncatum TaxID=327061 RepID=UPI0020079EB4|nr:uncharacterized protein F4807DRAFT_462242 [Annulohypoxylon truncatum]KAI1207798.1 hypothetical protein F4807DRAFT_462242 [Annulohypoxylon truncatum]
MKAYIFLFVIVAAAANAMPAHKRAEENTSSQKAGYHPDCGSPNSTKLCQERYGVGCNDDGSLHTGNYSFCGILVCKCRPN